MSKINEYLIGVEESLFPVFPEAYEVFVLGAGFSKAISSEMPTMAELTRQVRESVSLPEGLSSVNDFEFLLNYLSLRHPWLTEAQYLRNRALYLEIAREISNIIRQASQSAYWTAPPDFLTTLFDYWSYRRCSVITFNYDTLLESLYWKYSGRLPSHPASLVPADVSGVRFTRLFEGFSLQKLHGSINWFFSGNTDYANESVFYYRPYNPSGDMAFEDARERSFCGEPVHYDPEVLPVWDKEPFIVPPLAEKTSFFRHRVLRNEWVSASRALTKAYRIFFIGYSLPMTDLTVRYLLANSTQERSVDCIIVDRNQKVVDHYAAILGEGYRVGHVFTGDHPLDSLADHLKTAKREGFPPAYGLSEDVERVKFPSDEELEHLLDREAELSNMAERTPRLPAEPTRPTSRGLNGREQGED